MNSGSGILRGRRILVVEDEAMASLMLKDLLTDAGCTVIGPVGTTVAALALVEQETIHCGVLDIKLTDGISVPVAEALAARGIPFIVATGYDAIPAAYNGAPVFRKLFMADEVVDAIADILRP
jgi:DNA-binding NtrC family response regulator